MKAPLIGDLAHGRLQPIEMAAQEEIPPQALDSLKGSAHALLECGGGFRGFSLVQFRQSLHFQAKMGCEGDQGIHGPPLW